MMQRKIPTLAGILLVVVLIAAVAVTTSLVGRVTKLFSSANQSLSSVEAKTANVSDKGFAVYWTTSVEATGTVGFGKTPALEGGVAFDDRDLTGQVGKYFTHFVRITGLSPSTKYYFTVTSGGTTFGDKTKKEGTFEITTLAKSSSGPTQEPIFGKILDPLGDPAAGVIVVWNGQKEEKIATISTKDGSYVLPVGNIANGSTETIGFDAGEAGKATLACRSGLDRPLPTIKLGSDVDCTKVAPGTNNPTSTGSAGFKSNGVIKTNISEGETVSSPLPTISGKAGPNQVVKIEVHSETPYSGTVRADSSGNWSWTPPSNLSVGQHTVTITIQNADGTIQTVTRTFFVSAGEPILPITSGTPSATLPPVEPPPAATPSPEPTPPPAPPDVPLPPVTGRTESTLVMLLLGFVFATLGIGIFRKSENG